MENINIGTVANDNNGDRLRDAFIKINNNFNDVYKPRISTGIKTSILGDSNTDVGDSTDTAYQYRNILSPVIFLRALLLGKINLPPERNYGFNGSTFASNITNGRVALAAGDSSELVIVALGINDINNGRTFTQIAADIETYVQTLRHKTVLFLGIHPSGVTDANKRLIGYQVNAYLKLVNENNPNILFANPTKYLTDPASTIGAPKAGMLYDTVHYAVQGSYFAALAMKEVLEPFLKPVEFLSYNPEDVYDAVNNPTGNFLNNAMLLGAGGTVTSGRNITGTAPDGWTLTSSGTLGTAAVTVSSVDKDTAGKMMQMVFSGTAGASFRYRFEQSRTGVAGKRYIGRCGFEIAAGAENIESVWLSLFDAATPNFTCADLVPTTGQTLPTLSGTVIKGVMETPILTKGATGSTSILFIMSVNLKSAAVANATVRFYNPHLHVLD